MLKATLSRPRLSQEGLQNLEARWRSFAEAASGSFFQDWTWISCLMSERFSQPVLLEVFDDKTRIALALFQSRRSPWVGDTLYLHESDDAVLNSTFVEHNGPLILDQDRRGINVITTAINGAMFAPIDGRSARPRRVVLSGVSADCAKAATLADGIVTDAQSRNAPYIDFRRLLPDQNFIEQLSRNTRYQLRRSNRLYERSGPLTLHRADTVDIGLEFFQELIKLHSLRWNERGKLGAFSNKKVQRFYYSLLETGIPRGEVDLLQIKSGMNIVGYLMNFKHRNRVLAYQSGFDYHAATAHQKPGMTCHCVAIEHYRNSGFASYDFLAGPDRYKLSLANAQRELCWISIAPNWHPATVKSRLRALLGSIA